MEIKRTIETLLLCSKEPLATPDIKQVFERMNHRLTEHELTQALAELAQECETRGVELVAVAGGYRYQSRQALRAWLQCLEPLRKPRITRAQLETITIIAYKQPVTRADIEKIRGTSTSSDMIALFLKREWIRPLGTLDAPGKPTLYGTTAQFLQYFQLNALSDLPAWEEEPPLLGEPQPKERPHPLQPSVLGTADKPN